MQVRNGTSRYHLAIEIFEKGAAAGVISQSKASELVAKIHHQAQRPPRVHKNPRCRPRGNLGLEMERLKDYFYF